MWASPPFSLEIDYVTFSKEELKCQSALAKIVSVKDLLREAARPALAAAGMGVVVVALKSAPLPGGNTHMKWISCVGYCCECAPDDAATKAASPIAGTAQRPQLRISR